MIWECALIGFTEFIFFFFLKDSLKISPGWPKTHYREQISLKINRQPSCICFLRTGIAVLYYHASIYFMYLIEVDVTFSQREFVSPSSGLLKLTCI